MRGKEGGRGVNVCSTNQDLGSFTSNEGMDIPFGCLMLKNCQYLQSGILCSTNCRGGSVSSTSVHQRIINCRLFHNSTRVCDSKTLIADTLFSIMSLRTFCNSSFASHFCFLSFSLPLHSICTGRATLGQTAPKPLEPSHAM